MINIKSKDEETEIVATQIQVTTRASTGDEPGKLVGEPQVAFVIEGIETVKKLAQWSLLGREKRYEIEFAVDHDTAVNFMKYNSLCFDSTTNKKELTNRVLLDFCRIDGINFLLEDSPTSIKRIEGLSDIIHLQELEEPDQFLITNKYL